MKHAKLLLVLLLLGCQGPSSESIVSSTSTSVDEVTLNAPQHDPLVNLSVEATRLAETLDMPMLLLGGDYDAESVLTSGDDWYAIQADMGSYYVSLHATRKVQPSIEDAPVFHHKVRGLPANATTNDLIQGVGWIENGVAYLAEVECAQPQSDRRCESEAFITQVANSMVEVAR